MDASESRGQWTRYHTQDGQAYYHNAHTDVTTWDPPSPFREAPATPPAVTWVRYATPDGKFYYFHVGTQVTQWEPPPVFITSEAYEAMPPAETGAPGASAGAATAAAVEEEAVVDESDPWAVAQAAYVSEVLGATPQMGQLELQAVEFRKMLLSLQIPEGYSWTETVEDHSATFERDPRFMTVAPSRRALLFGEFQVARKAALIRRLERESAIVAAEFRTACEAAPKLGVGVSADEARRLYGDSEWWRAVKDPAVAQELYEDWEWEKQKQQWQLEEKETAEAVEAIRNEIPNVVPSKIISGSDFPPLMQWAQFCQLMEKDPRWKRVPGVKRVQLFEDHIRTLEEQQAQIESEERKHRHWNSLMVREALTKLLNDLWAAGKIDYATEWPIFRDSFLFVGPDQPGELLSRFLDALYSGTCVRDLFEAFIESHRTEFEEWAKDVPSTLATAQRMSWEEFESACRALPAWSRSLSARPRLLRLLHHERQSHFEKVEHDRAAFVALLQEVYPPNERDARWSRVRHKLKSRTAYKALESDTRAKELWEQWMTQQMEEGELFVPERGSSPDSPDAARGKKKRSRSRSRN